MYMCVLYEFIELYEVRKKRRSTEKENLKQNLKMKERDLRHRERERQTDREREKGGGGRK